MSSHDAQHLSVDAASPRSNVQDFARALTSPAHEHGAPLRPEDRRAQVAGAVGARAHVGGRQRRRGLGRRTTCSRCCPTRPASRTWATSRTTRWATRSRTSSAASGRRVLHPMGYDAFGLPAENHAISSGEHPRDSTQESIDAFHREFRSWGISIDWSREFGSNEPRYYRWTQWIFLKLYERGLAYRAEAAVNWCPKDADRARQRAGHRRPLRALRHAGRGAPAGAVVLPHHRLRRPPARRPRDDRVARRTS